jgi:hypothetical protein
MGPFRPETGNGADSAGSLRGEITRPKMICILNTSSHAISVFAPIFFNRRTVFFCPRSSLLTGDLGPVIFNLSFRMRPQRALLFTLRKSARDITDPKSARSDKLQMTERDSNTQDIDPSRCCWFPLLRSGTEGRPSSKADRMPRGRSSVEKLT